MGVAFVAQLNHSPTASPLFLSKRSPEPLPVWREEDEGSYGSCVHIIGEELTSYPWAGP